MMMPYQPNNSALLNFKYLSLSRESGIHVAFVDPFASVAFLGKKLKEAGILTTAIYTLIDAPEEYFSSQHELFDHVFYVNDHKDLSQVADILHRLKVNYIFYGSELSVQTTDILANIITPNFANCVFNTHARSDKCMLYDTLTRQGIPCVKQMKVTKSLLTEQEQELSEWQFPVIGKPINNLAMTSYTLCYTLEDLKLYLKDQCDVSVVGQLSFYHLIQEYVDGPEMLIDLFSFNGQHYVSGVQKYTRTLFRRQPIGLYSDIIPLESSEAKSCIAFAKLIVDSIGLKNGFSHLEIVLTKDGPRLIEINPCLSGAHGFNNKLFAYCGLPSQVDLMIAASQHQHIPSYEQTCHGRKVYLHNYEERRLNALNLALLYTLPSFREAIMTKRPGSIIASPQSLSEAIGFVILTHQDKHQIEQDYQQILTWQNNLELF